MARSNDIEAHKGTYGGFIGLLKWSVPLIVAIAAIVIILIAD